MKVLIFLIFGFVYSVPVFSEPLPPLPPAKKENEKVLNRGEKSSAGSNKAVSTEKMVYDSRTGGVFWRPKTNSDFFYYLKKLLRSNEHGRDITKATPLPPVPPTKTVSSAGASKESIRSNSGRFLRLRNGGVLWLPNKNSEFYRYLEKLLAEDEFEDDSRNSLSVGLDYDGAPITTGSSNGSDGFWHYESEIGAEGNDLVKSGDIPEGGNSWLGLNVATGQGQAYAIKFNWKVSCHQQDELRFLYNDFFEVFAVSGHTIWKEFIGVLYHELGTPMNHSLRFVFEKNSHFEWGANSGFLDAFQTTPLVWGAELKLITHWSEDRSSVELFWPVDETSNYQLESKNWSSLQQAEVEPGWSPITTPVDVMGPFFKMSYTCGNEGMRWFRLRRIDE